MLSELWEKRDTIRFAFGAPFQALDQKTWSTPHDREREEHDVSEFESALQ